jgi:glutamate synthase (NADPH/NADH) small chain
MPEKKPLDLNRRGMPKQRPEDRIKNFDEVALGYSPEVAMAEARRCIGCPKHPCIDGCPVEIDIPAFIKLIAEGDFAGAIRKMKEKNLLPAMCGRVCPQETQCEKTCVLAKKGAPIAIGRLERFVADWEAEQKEVELPEIAPKTGKRIAVVGSGPAGLTVAADLIKMGHDVVIFEALHEPGGVCMYGIPEFRLPKKIVRREVEFLERLGVKLVLNFIVGRTATIDDLLKDFDAVFIGTGAGSPWFMNIPGENLNGVYSANEYLTRSNLMKAYLFPEYDTPIKKGRRVAVVGGGNVAMDSARTALRLGAEESHIVYRRSREEMPARLEEIENAEEEGVIFDYLTLPVKYIGDENGWVKAAECIKMRLGEPDASGRRRPVPIEGSNFIMPVDTVVCAIGQGPNPIIQLTTPGLEADKKRGTLIIDKATGRTTKERVWAGGDIVTGGTTVIEAMGQGRIAARNIAEFLEKGVW